MTDLLYSKITKRNIKAASFLAARRRKAELGREVVAFQVFASRVLSSENAVSSLGV
jgi:hypothetical protein